MKVRAVVVALVLAISSAAFADEVSDALAKAAELYKAGKFVEAKTEIEKALEAITPLAKAQYPAPEVRDRTYVNYERSFRVSCPEKDWKMVLLQQKTPTAGATEAFCQISWVKDEAAHDEIVIFYARDLKAFLGARFARIKGREMAFVKQAGRTMASSIKGIEDVQITGQNEITLAGSPAVRTHYRARKGLKGMKCFTVDILRGHMLFTGMFVGTMEHDEEIAPAFEEILRSIDLSPVPVPEP